MTQSLPHQNAGYVRFTQSQFQNPTTIHSLPSGQIIHQQSTSGSVGIIVPPQRYTNPNQPLIQQGQPQRVIIGSQNFSQVQSPQNQQQGRQSFNNPQNLRY